MGKAQKKKSMRRHNPVRVPDSHIPKGLDSASASSSRKEAVLPIIQKMESPEPSDRKWACVTVSNIIQNDPATRRLLQGKNVVGALINRLTDSEEEVLVEAMGALRNLCIDGGYEICAEMYNKNILAPLQTFIPKISSTVSQFLEHPKSAPENTKKLIHEFADNVITVLWCLSETSNKALNAVNNLNLTPFLMSFLAARDKLPINSVSAAAHCLYILTEDNRPVTNSVRHNDAYVSCLLEIAKESTPHMNVNSPERSLTLRVLVAGILKHLSPLPRSPDVDIDKDIVLPLLQPVIISVPLAEASASVERLLEKQAAEPEILSKSVDTKAPHDHKSPIELELERIEGQLRMVHLALEVLTGTCATLPDPDVALDDATGEPEEDGDEDEDEDEDLVTGENEDDDEEMDFSVVENDDGVAVDVASTLSNSTTPLLPSLVEPLLQLVLPTSLSFPPPGSASRHPPTTSVLGAIHIGALECLNNIFLGLASNRASARTLREDAASGRRVWDALWAALAQIGTDIGPGQERKHEVWEMAIGALWGVGNIWKGHLVPQEEQIQILTRLCGSSSDDQVRVRCIGTLECLAQHPTSIEANKIISSYLLSLLPSSSNANSASTPPEPLFQAVSALIDIYSDEGLPYDGNFRTGGFGKRMSEAVEGVRRAVKAVDRKREGGRELRRHGEEVRDNLVAFLQYRKSLRLGGW